MRRSWSHPGFTLMELVLVLAVEGNQPGAEPSERGGSEV